MSKLSRALRDLRGTVRDLARDQDNQDLRNAADLVAVLASIIDGREPLLALGAPGDWGYGTPIGDGVLDAIRQSQTTPSSCNAQGEKP